MPKKLEARPPDFRTRGCVRHKRALRSSQSHGAQAQAGGNGLQTAYSGQRCPPPSPPPHCGSGGCRLATSRADVGTYEKANATRAPLTTMKSRMFHKSLK